jgi:hypothetical protein
MADQPTSTMAAIPVIKARLEEIAGLLRESDTLDPASRKALANLVEELTRTLASDHVPPAEMAKLAETAAALGEALHHQRPATLVGKAREDLKRAVARAEDVAPLTVGLARQFLDALANIGI